MFFAKNYCIPRIVCLAQDGGGSGEGGLCYAKQYYISLAFMLSPEHLYGFYAKNDYIPLVCILRVECEYPFYAKDYYITSCLYIYRRMNVLFFGQTVIVIPRLYV